MSDLAERANRASTLTDGNEPNHAFLYDNLRQRLLFVTYLTTEKKDFISLFPSPDCLNLVERAIDLPAEHLVDIQPSEVPSNQAYALEDLAASATKAVKSLPISIAPRKYRIVDARLNVTPKANHVTVMHNARGIPRDCLPASFSRKGPYSIVRKIVELAKGDIEVISKTYISGAYLYKPLEGTLRGYDKYPAKQGTAIMLKFPNQTFSI